MGNHVVNLDLDADQFILYMADQGAGRIFSVDYSPEVKEKFGVVTGMAKYLYEDEFGLKDVSCMKVDTKGDIFWGTESKG